MTREAMINKVIQKWGFESEVAISFYTIAEEWASDYAVQQMFETAMIIESEEE